MKRRDTHDLIGGLLMSATGVFFALYGSQYAMGSAARMGPGYFPVVLGWMLAVLGLLVALPAWWRQGDAVRVQWKNLFWSVACLIVFAAALRPLGVVLAAFFASLVALVPTSMRLSTRLVLCAIIGGLTALIFLVGLRMTLPMWPFGS